MAFEINDNSGSLFKNDKGDNPKRPDYTGNGKVNGEFVRIAAWLTQDRNGNTYMSLKFTEPEPERQKEQAQARGQAAGADEAPPTKDDLPF